MRIRIAQPAPGTVWGVREAARLLTVDASVIRYQLAKGKIARLGDGVDARSAWDWVSDYEPHKDNAQRRVRGHTLSLQASTGPRQASGAALDVPSGAPAGQNHGQAAGSGLLRGRALVAVGTPARVKAGASQLPVLDTREWVQKFYVHQTQLMGGALHPKTKSKYDLTFGRFAAAFPIVPMDPIAGREILVAWIHGLRNSITGAPMADGSKATDKKVISTFYNWLRREHGMTGPSLEHTSLPGMPAGQGVVYMDEVPLVLAQTRDHTEYTLVLVFAQTGARLGELCSIRPECLQPYWVHTWDKRTLANLTGYRPLFLPDESYAAVQQEIKVYGELMLRGRPLAGLPVPVDDKGRPLKNPDSKRIRLDDPKTYRIDPMHGALDAVQYTIRRAMQRAGVYEKGKLVHAYRRAWKAEWAKNGGDGDYGEYVMGHFNKSSMASLYLRDKNDEIAAQVRKFAPRRFLLAEPGETKAAA